MTDAPADMVVETFADQFAAISRALAGCEPGDTFTVCGSASGCDHEGACPFCAVITVREGLTAQDVIDMARPGHG